MSSLAELPELVGFFSYSREDDEAFKGTLSALRDSIQRELSAQLGRSKRTFRLWQDQTAIAPGKLWESEIKTAIDGSFFFIPIVTPRSVSSKYCKFEFDAFLARERAIGRSDLVFPILYISVAALENEAKWRDDVVLSTIGRRQYVDWRPLRHLDVQTTAVREQIERLCQKIVEALNEPWTPPEERRRMEEVKARQQAEEEARRLEAEVKRRAEEERRRQEAESKRRADEEERRKRAEAEARPGAEDERRRQEAEAKLRAEQGQAFAAAIEPHKVWPISPAFLKRWLQNKQSARVAALAVLLLIGVTSYALLRHSVEGAVQRAELKWEQERRAAEAEANRKVAQAEEQRLAALKEAEQERQARATADAEAQPKATGRGGWLGLRIQQVTDEIAESLNVKPARGALVASVFDTGPAKAAGILQGDVIVKLDGKDITEMRDLPRIVAEMPVGKDVQVTIIRKGYEFTKTLKLGSLDAAEQQRGLFTIRRGTEASSVSGSTPDSFGRLSFEECEQRCAQQSTCSVFTRRTEDGACYLYSHAELKPNADFDSGVRN